MPIRIFLEMVSRRPTIWVDVALRRLDLGETVTIPSLPDMADWDAYEAARAALAPGLSRVSPAKRYGVRNPNKAS